MIINIDKMASNIPRCLLCANIIPDSKNQRNISYGGGIKIKDVIRGFLMKNNNDCNGAIDDYMESTNVVCKRNCFPSLTKLIKLREDTKVLCDKLANVTQISFIHFDSGRCGKRANPNEAPVTPHKRLRKEEPNTPTRQFLSTTLVNDEPVIAVRIIVKII